LSKAVATNNLEQEKRVTWSQNLGVLAHENGRVGFAAPYLEEGKLFMK
jgi:hypothetical protein